MFDRVLKAPLNSIIVLHKHVTSNNVSTKISKSKINVRKKVNDLESKVISLESDHNSLEQYGGMNNIEICGILGSFPDQNLERKVIKILAGIDFSVSTNDIEVCYRMGSSVNDSRRIITRFTNIKFEEKAFLNRSKLRKITSTSLNYSIFTNENLTLRNSKIAFLFRKLKRADHIEKTFTRNGTVHASIPDIQRRKVLKIHHLKDLFNIFPVPDFCENITEDEQNDSLQSSF